MDLKKNKDLKIPKKYFSSKKENSSKEQGS